MKASITMLGATLVLTGCGVLGGMDPVTVCAEQARENGPDFRVVGAFATTVSEVRDMTPGAVPARWPELAGESAAVVCYIDGSVPKAPPGDDPYDRAVIVVAGEHAELVIAGYHDQLPVEAP